MKDSSAYLDSHSGQPEIAGLAASCRELAAAFLHRLKAISPAIKLMPVGPHLAHEMLKYGKTQALVPIRQIGSRARESWIHWHVQGVAISATNFSANLFGRSQSVYRCQGCGQLYLNGNHGNGAPNLAEHEQRLLALMAAGKINKQIAGELEISLRTVHLRRKVLMAKIGASNKYELITKATELGLL